MNKYCFVVVLLFCCIVVCIDVLFFSSVVLFVFFIFRHGPSKNITSNNDTLIPVTTIPSPPIVYNTSNKVVEESLTINQKVVSKYKSEWSDIINQSSSASSRSSLFFFETPKQVIF